MTLVATWEMDSRGRSRESNDKIMRESVRQENKTEGYGQDS